MAVGRIKWYDEKKGYGFIQSESHGEVFLHQKGIKDFGYFGIHKNDEVSFDIKETPRGVQAINVKVL